MKAIRIARYFLFGACLFAQSVLAENTVSKDFLTADDGQGGKFQVPMVTIKGSKPGPVLALIAGVHGSEYAPIIALQQLLARLENADISGTLNLVMSASPNSFYKRTIYYVPNDWRNLNRSFPGKADGSPTERLAHLITTEVIQKCDYLVDVHAGDANESLMSYSSYDADTVNVQEREKSLEMARALLFPRIVRGRKRPTDPQALVYLTNAATYLHKPNVAIESGELGKTDQRYVEPIVSGLENLCRLLHILPGRAQERSKITYLESAGSTASLVDGLFYPQKKVGDAVKKGEIIGVIRNLFNEKLADVIAPGDGFILYLTVTPPVSKGESIAAFFESAMNRRYPFMAFSHAESPRLRIANSDGRSTNRSLRPEL